MTYKICVLGSGSSGNCTVIWNGQEALLIDCGRLGYRYVTEQLTELGISPGMIKGMLITHAHTDHISQTALSLSKKYAIPIYLHKRIYDNIRSGAWESGIRELSEIGLVRFHPAAKFRIGEFLVFPFNTHHRAGCVTMSLGFCVVYKGKKIGYVTDCGKIDDSIVAAMSGSHVAVIEANHRVDMVENGTRHWAAKKWVLSDDGHLSNDAAAELIARIGGEGSPLRHVLLAHISEDHNVLNEVSGIISRLVGNDSILISVTYHRVRSRVIDVSDEGGK